jgi:hypothetical protein
MKSTFQIICSSGFVAIIAGCSPLAIPPTTTATGTNAHSIDEVADWVKGSYHDRSPETPPYITNQAAIVPAAQLFPLFSSQGVPIDVRKTDYRYCNLPNSHWLLLRAQSPRKFPVLWTPTPDASGRRRVVTVDFKTDLFWLTKTPEQTFTNELARMEAAIRNGTGETTFSLLQLLHE